MNKRILKFGKYITKLIFEAIIFASVIQVVTATIKTKEEVKYTHIQTIK